MSVNMDLYTYEKFMERHIKHSGISSGEKNERLGIMFGKISLSIFHISILFKF